VSRRDRIAAGALLGVGLGQMLSSLAGFPALAAVFSATHASPAPKVFSAVQGLETYSTTFYLDWTDEAGNEHSQKITPELYARLEGPYNRRNVYGAVFAFGPVLAARPATAPMFESVLRSSLCEKGEVLAELGLDRSHMKRVRIRLEPLRPGALGSLQRTFEPDCP
jgi:hypothetical protein